MGLLRNLRAVVIENDWLRICNDRKRRGGELELGRAHAVGEESIGTERASVREKESDPVGGESGVGKSADSI